MNVHKNARLTPRGREVLVSRLERGEHPRDVGTALGVSASTVYKWWRRYRAEGPCRACGALIEAECQSQQNAR